MDVGKMLVILTALDVEYKAVRSKLTDLQVHTHRAGTRFEVGTLAGRRSQVAITQVGKGNHSAAVLTERAIEQFHPAALLFVGVAGRLRSSLALGDVVVATHVYAYHGGASQDDGLKSRPRVWEVSHRALQIAQHVRRTGDWVRHLPPGEVCPEIVFGAIAAGEIVQDSTISAEAQWIRDHYNDACAIEMEAAGVAQAAHLNDSLAVVVIRGISDPADGSKAAADSAGWQLRAAANAAAFGAVLAGALADELGERQGQRPSDREPGLGGSPNINIATGNAHGIVQAQNVYGGVWLGPDPRNGSASFSAADQATSPRRKLRQALSWVRSALCDLASLAANATAVFAAVRGSA